MCSVSLVRSLLMLMLIPFASVWAADGPVIIRVPPPLAPELDAMPQIARPTSAAERRLNTHLKGLDASALHARAECHATPPEEAYWNRSVEVPMRGPRFLSIVVTQGDFCGGAHSNTETEALTFDLRSGQSVNLAFLLPDHLTVTSESQPGRPRTRSLSLTSRRMRSLFFSYYDDGTTSVENENCKSKILRGTEIGYRLSAWLDAEQGGLVLKAELPRPDAECTTPIAIPLAELRKQGANPDLLLALELASRHTAHAQRRTQQRQRR